METMKSLKIHYLDKREITLRTDCQAIISFYNKSSNNKPSRVRWLNFVDFITGTGVEVKFEHIDGKLNVLADSLSRLTNFCFVGCLNTEEHENLTIIQDCLPALFQNSYNYWTWKQEDQLARKDTTASGKGEKNSRDRLSTRHTTQSMI